MRVRPLGWEDHLKMVIATRSSILAWEIPWTEEPGGLPSIGQDPRGHVGLARLSHLPSVGHQSLEGQHLWEDNE